MNGKGSLMMEKYKTLILNIIIFAFGSFLVKLISFILMPIYTSFLTTEQYGVAELLNSIVEIVLPIVTLCIIEALYRFSIDNKNDYSTLFTNSIALVILGNILVGIICLILKFVFKINYCFIFWGLYCSCTLYKVTIQFARGLGHSKRYSLYGIINSIILILSNIILLKNFNMGITGYILSFVLGYGITAIIALILSKEYKYFSISSLNKKILLEMLKYSMPCIPNMISWWFNSVSDRYMIIAFCGIHIGGLYTAASKLPALINVISSIFQLAWQYSTAKEISKDNSHIFFNTVLKWYAFITINSCLFLIIINDKISEVLLKDEFYAARVYVPLLLIAALFGCFSTYFGTFYNAMKDNKKLMQSTLYGALINIFLNLFLIPKFSAFGAAVATLITYLFIMIYRYIDIKKYINIKIDYKLFIIRIICIFIVAVSSIFITKKIFICVEIMLLLVSVFAGDEIKSVISKIRNKKLNINIK